MAVPAALITELQVFKKSLALAQPIQNASAVLAGILKQQGAQLLTDIDASLSAAAGQISASDPTVFAGDLPSVLDGLATSADDQTTLSDMRGLVGRAVLNLAQAGA